MPDQKVPHLPEDWNKALALVAHPDDVEYGAASAVARWTSQGKDVVYIMVTRGEAGIDSLTPDESAKVRVQEEINSARAVGVETVEFLDHKDGVIEYGLPLRRDLTRAIRRHKPDIVLTNGIELTRRGHTLNMADHRWVGLAVLDASRDADNRWIFPELLEEGLEPWHGVRMVCTSGGEPDYYVDVSDCMDQGVAALKEHGKYIEGLDKRPDPDKMLRTRAAELGQRFGCEYAVAFKVVTF